MRIQFFLERIRNLIKVRKANGEIHRLIVFIDWCELNSIVCNLHALQGCIVIIDVHNVN